MDCTEELVQVRLTTVELRAVAVKKRGGSGRVRRPRILPFAKETPSNALDLYQRR